MVWETVTAFDGRKQVQVVAEATVLVHVDEGTRQISGQATIQRLQDTNKFRVAAEGVENGQPCSGLVELPLDQQWEITASALHTRNGGGRTNYSVYVLFRGNEDRKAGLRRVQVTLPLIEGNARRAKLFHESLIFADQCRREGPP